MPEALFMDDFDAEVDNTPTPKKTKKKVKKKTVKKKSIKKKVDAPEAPEAPGAPDFVATPRDEEAAPSETLVAQSIDRSDLGMAASQDKLTDTFPAVEDELTRAKREVPAVSQWDEFLEGISKGTLELLYEMGISGLDGGDRALVVFRKSTLLKPEGKMLPQHVEELESKLAEFGLTLAAEPAGATGAILPGQTLPDNVIPVRQRTRREKERRSLRRTM